MLRPTVMMSVVSRCICKAVARIESTSLRNRTFEVRKEKKSDLNNSESGHDIDDTVLG